MLIQTRQQFVAAKTALLQAETMAVDTETTGLRFFQGDRIIGISMCCALPNDPGYRFSFYFPFRHKPKELNLFTVSENLPEEWLIELKPVLERVDCVYIYHNFKFDAKMLANEGIRITERQTVFDTMVMSHMVNENGVHSLKGLAAEKWGDHVRIEEQQTKALVKKLGGWDKTSASEMEPYACKDVELTYDLWYVLLDELEEQDLMRLWHHSEEFLHCLKGLEWEGVEVDVELAREQRHQAEARMRQLEDALAFDPMQLDVLAHILYAAPPAGLGLPYLETSKTSTSEFPEGRPQMNEDVLSRYRHPVTDMVLEYRGLVKANSTWWKGYPEKMDALHRIHPEYATADKKEKYGTVTGRLSSSWPNIQQMPRDKSTPVKKLLKPPRGYGMWEFDYAQVELRLASAYAKDEVYIEAFKAGVDAHQATADLMGVDRQAAKHAAFCILYGGGATTLKATIERLHYLETNELIDFPLKDAEEILTNYYQIHPNLKSIAQQATNTAKYRGYVKLWNGKRRHFNETETWQSDGVWITRGGYPFARKAFNSIIQGGAACIMEETMLRLYRLYRDQYDDTHWRMVLQVHDSIWMEVKEEVWSGLICEDSLILQIKEIMEWPGQHFGLPFPVDAKLIRRYELEEVA